MTSTFAPSADPLSRRRGGPPGPAAGALARDRFGMGAGPVGPPNYMTAAMTGSGGGGMPAPAPAGAVPGVDPAWSRIFGTATPSALLAQRTAAGGVSPPPGAAAGAEATTAQPLAPEAAAATPTPQSAGAVNGATPGAFNGNPENGFSSEQQSGGQSNNEQGGPPPTPNYMTDAIRRTAAAPSTSSGVQAAVMPTPAVDVQQPERAAAGTQDVEGRDAAAPGAPAAAGADAGPSPGVQPKSMEMAPGSVTQAGATVNWGNAQYTTDVPKPAGLQGPAANDWIRAHYRAPAADAVIYGSDPAQVDFTKYPPPIKETLTNTLALKERYRILLETAAVAGNQNAPAMVRQISNLQAEIKQRVDALAKNGITFSDGARPTAPQTPPGGAGTSPPPTTPPTGTTTPPTGTTPPTDTTTPPTGTGTPPTTGVPGPDNPGTNTELSDLPVNSQTGYAQALQHYIDRYGADRGPAIFEALVAATNQQNQRNDVQSGVDVLDASGRALESDPLYTGAQGLARSMLDRPDPTDEQARRNKFIADQDKIGEQIVQNLSAGAGRRGLGAGAVAGIQSRALGENASSTASGLGDMTVEADARRRGYEEGALRDALTTLGGTTGVSMANRTNIANTLTGNPANNTNPFSGIAAAFANIDAAKTAADAANSAGQFSWQDAARLGAQALPLLLA